MAHTISDIKYLVHQTFKKISRLQVIFMVFYFLFLIIYSSSAHCQEYTYVPFPDSGAIWSEVYYPSISSGLYPIYERFVK